MVMGKCHATHGAAAGLAASNLAPLLGQPMTVWIALGLGATGAGAAIAADLDHPNATATRSLGPITDGASLLIRGLSAWIYARTRTPHDRDNEDGHRGITHTIPGAVGMGGFFGGACAIARIWGADVAMWTTAGFIWLLLVWALRALPPKHGSLRDYMTATVLAGLTYWAFSAGGYADSMPLLIGITIAVGTLVHSLGDGLTLYGSPLWWPIIRKGQRWYGAGSPKCLRFPAGKRTEERYVFPASVLIAGIALVGVIPGVWPTVFRLVGQLWAS